MLTVVTLRTSAPLPNRKQITVEGITGTQTPDDDAIEISGTSQNTFGSKGTWRKMPGKLVFQLISQLSHGVDHILSFKFRNPISYYDLPVPPGIYIKADRNESADTDVDIMRVKMPPSNGTKRVLNIIDLLDARIKQTLVSAGEINNITLTIFPSEDIIAPWQIITLS